MKFRQLPKEKRNNLVLVALLTAIALGGIGFGLIRFQYDHLKAIAADTEAAEKKLRDEFVVLALWQSVLSRH